jgi:DNA integrity scanning protein DisA with diadenylate cyclase activity
MRASGPPSLFSDALAIINRGGAAAAIIIVSRAQTANATKPWLPADVPTVWAATTAEALGALGPEAPIYLPYRLDRLQILSYAVVHAIIEKRIDAGRPLVCLVEGRRGFDLLQTMKPDVDLDLANIGSWTPDRGIDPNALLAVLRVAVELGSDRTGRAAGTLMTIGDAAAVLALGDDYPFEPFGGCRSELRNITSLATQAGIQKYARVDGVFVVGGDGRVERFVKQVNPRQRSSQLDPSLGSRHAAAAGITLDTRALAVLVTESGGDIKLFGDGRLVLAMKPR